MVFSGGLFVGGVISIAWSPSPPGGQPTRWTSTTHLARACPGPRRPPAARPDRPPLPKAPPRARWPTRLTTALGRLGGPQERPGWLGRR